MGRFNLVSSDSHVVEPPDLWTERVAPAFRARAPHVQRDENGEDAFFCDGQRLLAPAAMSQAGKADPDRDRSVNAVYRGAFDPKARLADMARDGVDAEVVYPSIAMRIFAVPDPSLQQACFEAYNSWAAEFCKGVPGRFQGVAVIALEDIEQAVAEARRARDLGLAGLMISIAGDDPNLYGDASYDRFWAVAEELGMPVSLHIITNQKPITFNVISDTLAMVDVMQALTNMVFGGVFDRFPKLKVVSAENDGGWVGYFMERMDRVFTEPRRNKRRNYPINGKGMLPSEYMRRNVALTFIRDRTAVEARHWIGVENLMWSSDYPHNDSTWPNSQATLDYVFAGVPDTDRSLIAAGNAERLYGLG
jgi:predicted TIM-barrel fold metal-dependent hydrolase